MNKLSSFIGSSVYTINTCECVGTVFSIGLNKLRTKISSLYIFDDERDTTYRIPATKIFAIGPKILIKNITSLSVVPDSTLETFMNCEVISIDGTSLGNVVDVEFDNKFTITAIKTSTTSFLPNKIVNFSNGILIVNTPKTNYHLSYFSPNKNSFGNASISTVEALSSVLTPTEITGTSQKL